MKYNALLAAAFSAVALVLGGCASSATPVVTDWSFKGKDLLPAEEPKQREEQPQVVTAERAPEEIDYTLESTRFEFHPRLIIYVDENGEVIQEPMMDEGGYDQGGGEE